VSDNPNNVWEQVWDMIGKVPYTSITFGMCLGRVRDAFVTFSLLSYLHNDSSTHEVPQDCNLCTYTVGAT
jgi:hypothetical protein